MSQAEVEKLYYPFTNHLYHEVFVNNGKREGNYKKYYKTGELKIDCHYINGKLNGSCKTYYKSGKLKLECNYINGKKEGILYSYEENYKTQLNYINGNIEGKAYIYITDSNILCCEIEYKNGKQCGEFKTYYDDGSVKNVFSAINLKKNGNYKKYDENNNILVDCNYKNNLLHGECKIYENGKEETRNYYYGTKNKIILKIASLLKLK